jgi:hypothetical protein
MCVGVVSVFTDVEAKPPKPPKFCVCTMEYDPVLCDDGNVYSNLCVAHCAGATGCERIGPGPIPFPL